MNQDLLTLLELIKKYNLTETELIFKCESGISDAIVHESNNSNFSLSLTDQYYEFYGFVNNSSTIHLSQLRVFLYPVFLHIYIKLLALGRDDEAKKFFTKFATSQEDLYKLDLLDLQIFSQPFADVHNCFLDIFRANEFTLKISRQSLEYIQQKFLNNKLMKDLSNLINQKLRIEVIDLFPLNEVQIDRCRGAFSGESIIEGNLLKFDSDIPRVNLSMPSLTTINRKRRRLIEWNLEEINEIDTLGGGAGRFVFDSILHGVGGLGDSRGICAVFSGDCDSLAVGTVTGDIHVNHFTSAANLDRVGCQGDLSNDPDDAQFGLIGCHKGAVYEMSWSINRELLLSSSSDGTVKCWRTATKDCVATFSAPGPIWSVDLAPISEHYIACGTNNESVNLYAPDNPVPVRQFTRGIHGPVTCVRFHGNGNYVGSGGVDRTVRLFDIRSGTLVRSFTGHKAVVSSLRFSLDGKYLISGCENGLVNIWDLGSSDWLLKSLSSDDHSENSKGPVMNMDLSRDQQILAVGRQGGQIDVWDYRGLILSNEVQRSMRDETDLSSGILGAETQSDESILYLAEGPRRAGLCDILYTKTFPVKALQFNRRDILHCCVFYSDLLPGRSA